MYRNGRKSRGGRLPRIRLNYADGTKHEFPMLFGGHVRDWHRMPSEEKELLTDPNTKIVWRAPGMPRINSTMRLFKSMLANPHPEKVVTTMDVVSSKRLAAYDLIAATVANRDASRPVTPPRPPDEPERHFEGTLTIHVTEQGTGQPVAGALVQPTMNMDEVSVIAIPFLTCANGEGVFRYPVEHATSVSVSVEKEGYGSHRASVALEASPTNRSGGGAEVATEAHRRGAGRSGRGAGGGGVGALAGVAGQLQGRHHAIPTASFC